MLTDTLHAELLLTGEVLPYAELGIAANDIARRLSRQAAPDIARRLSRQAAPDIAAAGRQAVRMLTSCAAGIATALDMGSPQSRLP